MTKKEQQKLDKRLEHIAEKLLFDGWQYNRKLRLKVGCVYLR